VSARRTTTLGWLLLPALCLVLATPLEAARFKRLTSSAPSDSLRAPVAVLPESMAPDHADPDSAAARPAGPHPTGLFLRSLVVPAEYQSYAMRVAGARRHGDGSDYWVAVSNHLSREAYNQAMLEANGWNQRYLDPADDWSLPGAAEQNRYRDLRAVSEKALSQSLAVGGALFINHVLSAAQALRLVRQAEPGGPALTALPVPGGLGLALSLDLSTPRP